MKELAELLTALSALAWPVAFVGVALLFRRFIGHMLTRESVSLKVAGMELSVADAAKKANTDLTDLQQRLAELEQRLKAAGTEPPQLVDRPSRDRGVDRTVLWVDDYPSNNAFLIQKFESEGIRVRKEISTESALVALRHESFGAIISDLGRDENGVNNPWAGLEFLEAVRKEQIDTPVLIFAGQRGLASRDRLIAAGATDVTASAVDVFSFIEKYTVGA